MAEIGLLASIVQVADIGLRLSLRLYAFGETVASADGAISAISSDVSLTSSVLKELGDVLKNDSSRIYSDNAVKTADAVVRECSKAFKDMDEMLLKKVPQLHTGDVGKQSRASLILERLRWPAIKGKIDLLRVNLDRMKSTLTLMLNVIIYAKQVSERKESPSILSNQRQLIEDLAKANDDRERKFNDLRLVLEGTHLDQTRPGMTSKPPPAFTTSLVALPPTMGQDREGSAARIGQHSDRTRPFAYEPSPMTKPAIRILLDEFTRLHSSLLTEVRSTQYQIGNEARARYESDITSRHTHEIQVAFKPEQNDGYLSAPDSYQFSDWSGYGGGPASGGQASPSCYLPHILGSDATSGNAREAQVACKSEQKDWNLSANDIYMSDYSSVYPTPLKSGGQKDNSENVGFERPVDIPPQMAQMPQMAQPQMAPPQMADEKRKCNATASHSFRQREAANNITGLEQQAKNMADERDSSQRERDALQSALSRHDTSLSTSNTAPDERSEELLSAMLAPYDSNRSRKKSAKNEPRMHIASASKKMKLTSEYEPPLDEPSVEQAEDVTSVTKPRSSSTRTSATSEPEVHDQEHFRIKTASVLGRPPPPSVQRASISSVNQNWAFSADCAPASFDYQCFPIMNEQVASQGDHGAGRTSDALSLPRDTTTVDNLVSKWTNLVTSSPKD